MEGLRINNKYHSSDEQDGNEEIDDFNNIYNNYT